MNNPTLIEFCFNMIGRADIEGSKSNVAMNAWLPQASSFLPTDKCFRQNRPFPGRPSNGPVDLGVLCRPVRRGTLSGGSSPYLKPELESVSTHLPPTRTHTLASVEPPSILLQKQEAARSAADRLYFSDCYPLTPKKKNVFQQK